MPTRRTPEELAGALRDRWDTLAQAAACIMAVLGTFLLAPPAGVSSPDGNTVVQFTRFSVAVLLALMFVPMSRWDRKKDGKWWGAATLLALAATAALFFRYGELHEAKTVRYGGSPVVVGDRLTPLGADYRRSNPFLTDEELLQDAAGRADVVWTGESIDRNRRRLATTYFASASLAALCVIMSVQILVCGTPRKREAPGTSRKRKATAPEPPSAGS